MRFYTPEECVTWCELMQIPLTAGAPEKRVPRQHRLRCAFPGKFSQLLWFSRCLEAALRPRLDCLLWMTGYRIYESNENEHLYYRLRQSYGDQRLLHEAPGHLCLKYEGTEVITFLHLGILFGWDMHLIPVAGYAQAFVSHDEWVEIGFDDERLFNKTHQTLEQAKLTVTRPE